MSQPESLGLGGRGNFKFKLKLGLRVGRASDRGQDKVLAWLAQWNHSAFKLQQRSTLRVSDLPVSRYKSGVFTAPASHWQWN
jgi:hypothetical protein